MPQKALRHLGLSVFQASAPQKLTLGVGAGLCSDIVLKQNKLWPHRMVLPGCCSIIYCFVLQDEDQRWGHFYPCTRIYLLSYLAFL